MFADLQIERLIQALLARLARIHIVAAAGRRFDLAQVSVDVAFKIAHHVFDTQEECLILFEQRLDPLLQFGINSIFQKHFLIFFTGRNLPFHIILIAALKVLYKFFLTLQ